jgi:hypothetical protein
VTAHGDRLRVRGPATASDLAVRLVAAKAASPVPAAGEAAAPELAGPQAADAVPGPAVVPDEGRADEAELPSEPGTPEFRRWFYGS